MALPTELWRENGTVCFILSNRPEIKCYLDEEDYEIVQHNKCWFTYEKKDEGLFYIRRSIYLSQKKIITQCIHEFILTNKYGVLQTRDKCIYHINKIGVDNRKQNLEIK
jgi:hypothetical protein